jgi:hypothetical protein
MAQWQADHRCDPDTSRLGLWRCEVCGQCWEIHGVADQDIRARKVSRLAWFFVKLLG